MSKSKNIFIGVIMALIIIGIYLAWNFSGTGGVLMPTPELYSEGGGAKYAFELANSSQKLSFLLLIIGWICVSCGGLLAITGAVVGSTQIDDNRKIFSIIKAQKGLLCASLAVVFAGVGWQCLDRSSAASLISSIATKAIAVATINVASKDNQRHDIQAYKICIEAKSAWLEGRMSHDRIESIFEALQTNNNTEKPNIATTQGPLEPRGP